MNDLGIAINAGYARAEHLDRHGRQGNFQWSLGSVSGGATPYEFYRGQMSKLTVLPMGQSANENWNSLRRARTRISCIEQFGQTSDVALQKDIMKQARNGSSSTMPPPFRSSPGRTGTSSVPRRFTGFPTASESLRSRCHLGTRLSSAHCH